MSNFICRNYVYLFYQFYLLQKIRTDNRRHTLTCIQCVETFPSFVLHHYKININSSNNKHSRQNITFSYYLQNSSSLIYIINYKIIPANVNVIFCRKNMYIYIIVMPKCKMIFSRNLYLALNSL